MSASIDVPSCARREPAELPGRDERLVRLTEAPVDKGAQMRLRAVSETVSLVVPVQQLLEALRGDTEFFRDAGPRPSNTVGEQQNLLLHRVEVTPKAIHGQPPVPALVDIFDEVATRYRINVVERSGGPPTSSAELTDHVTLRYPEQPSTDVVRLLASAAKLQQSNPGFLVGIVERCFRWRRSEARAQIA